jgi:hypothetical protein
MKLPERVRRVTQIYELDPLSNFASNYIRAVKKKKSSKKKTQTKKGAPVAPKKQKKTTQKKALSAPKQAPKKPTTAGAVSSNNRVLTADEFPLSRKQSIEADRRFREGLTTHKWQYKADSGKFLDYVSSASTEVEKAYASWTVNPHIDVRAVKSGDWEYHVDFNLMEQTNVRHPNHKKRTIQRVPL